MNQDENFKEIVRASFKKVREDMLKLENMALSLKREIEALKTNFSIESSTGNRGVSNKPTNQQTNQQTDKQTINRQSQAIKGFNEDLEAHFKGLTRQEFLVFLSLYQLEEEIGQVKFQDLAIMLKLSGSSIRGYISNLINKGSPIERKRVNNKMIYLSVSQEFRSLGMKKRLTDLFYSLDTSQKRLFDDF